MTLASHNSDRDRAIIEKAKSASENGIDQLIEIFNRDREREQTDLP